MKRDSPEFWRVLGLRSMFLRAKETGGEYIRAGCPDELFSDEPDDAIIAKAPRGFVAGDLP